jgi:hypothetical protein
MRPEKWLSFFVILAFALCLFSFSSLYAQTPSPCVAASDLESGKWARLINTIPTHLRENVGLSAPIIARIPPGDIMEVLDGDRCADGYTWWRVQYDEQIGFIAEGDGDDIWLALLDGQPDTLNSETIFGCRRPPEDYGRITLNGFAVLNARTLAMLDHAQELYAAEGGVLRLRDQLMQGGYNAGGVAASFGTHDGGGALDLSVRDRVSRAVMTAEIPLMLQALRTAGFAAWLRREGQLAPGTVIHIHAIAIGDAELSDTARAQIDGEYGYFNGYNGLPPEWGGPARDDGGRRVLCAWMGVAD